MSYPIFWERINCVSIVFSKQETKSFNNCAGFSSMLGDLLISYLS